MRRRTQFISYHIILRIVIIQISAKQHPDSAKRSKRSKRVKSEHHGCQKQNCQNFQWSLVFALSIIYLFLSHGIPVLGERKLISSRPRTTGQPGAVQKSIGSTLGGIDNRSKSENHCWRRIHKRCTESSGKLERRQLWQSKTMNKNLTATAKCAEDVHTS